MSKTFFTADLHFFHKKITQFCPRTRPFADLESMHEALITSWNSQVGTFDHVYILGDLSFGSPEKTVEILARLNGILHLIKGNHDHWINPLTKTFFASIEDYKVFKQDGHRAVLFHYPIADWDRMHYGSFHLYGHVHDALKLPGKALDVGIDARPNADLALWEWQEIVEYMSTKPIMPHHLAR